MTSDVAPSTRADAARNRRRILNAAREAFNDTEADVSMAEICRRSGVGSATLYRNFASRRDLLEALLIDEVDELCAAAAQTVEGASPGERLLTWLRRVFDYITHKRPIVIELVARTDTNNPVFDTRARILQAGQPLLTAAHSNCELTTQLDLNQILDTVMAIAKIPGTPAHRQPILDLVLDSLTRPST